MTFKRILGFFIFPISICVLGGYIYYSEGWNNIKAAFLTLNYKLFSIVVLINLAIMFLDWVRVALMRRRFQKNVAFKYTVHAICMSNFFGGIMPPTLSIGTFASIVCFRKQGMDVGDSTTMVFANSIAGQIASIIMNIVIIGVGWNYLRIHLTPILWILFAISFLYTIFNICIVLIVPKFDRQILIIASFVIKFLSFIHLVKNKEIKLEKTRHQILILKENMSKLHLIFKKKDWLGTISCTVLQNVLGYIKPCLLCVAIGVSFNVPYHIYISANVVANTIISMVNFMPSSIGITELVSYFILKPIVSDGNINFILLFTRIVSLICLCIQGIALLIPIKKLDDTTNIREEMIP